MPSVTIIPVCKNFSIESFMLFRDKKENAILMKIVFCARFLCLFHESVLKGQFFILTFKIYKHNFLNGKIFY